MNEHIPDSTRPSNFELKITTLYFAAGVMWILFSDKVLELTIPNPIQVNQIQTYKGSFYIVVTALFLYLMVKQHLQKLRLANEERAKSESHYKALFIDNQSIILLINPVNGRIEDANPAACRFYGWTHEEFCRRSVFDISIKSDEIVIQQLKTINDEMQHHLFGQHRLANGEIRDVEAFLGPIHIGNKTKLYTTIQDITEQKKAEGRIHESEERYRTTLDQMLEGCQILGFDWTYLYINRSAEVHNRKKNQDLLGQRYMDIWPGITETHVFRVINEVLEKRTAHHLENQFQYPDGRIGWFDLSIQPVPEGVFILSVDISERKQKEQELHESEFRFRKLFENGPFGMATISNDFKILKANKTICDLLGYEESELLNLSFKEVSHPEDLRNDLPNVEKLIRKEIPVYKTEKRYIRKDGTIIWASLTVIPNYDSEGNFLYNLGVVEDITWRKQAEVNLLKSKQLLAETESIGKVGGWEFHTDTLLTTWTDEVFRIHEVDNQIQFDTNQGINFYTEESRPIVAHSVQRAIEFGEPFDLELEIVTAKGNLRNVHTIGKPDPEHRRVYGFFQDITWRKQVENALRESEEFLKLGYETAKLGIWKNNTLTGVIEFDEQARLHYGFDTRLTTLSEVLARIHPDDMDRLSNEIEKANSPGSDGRHATEYRVIHPDGSIHWLYVGVRLRFEGEGKNRHSVMGFGTTLEITDLKQLEISLKQKNLEYGKVNQQLLQTNNEVQELNEHLEKRVAERTVQLESANQELESFSYSVSHDLRAPLRHISGYLDLLKTHFSEILPDKAQYYMDTISQSTHQMGVLIDDLLQFSKTGRKELHMEMFELDKMVSDIIQDLKEDNQHRKINWNVDHLPNVFGDPILLKQVWINLLDNAVKYSRNADIAEITIGVKKDPDSYVFSVRDNGVGFEMKYAHKLFGVFQRLHSQEEFEGTGIGLANVQRILVKHNGKVWVEAALEKGATFYFSLPKSHEEIK